MNLRPALLALALAGCASTGSSLHDAEAEMAALNAAQDYVNVTVAGRSLSPEEERAALAPHMPAIQACEAGYDQGMRAMFAAQLQDGAAVSEVQQLDRAYSACLAPLGLQGQHEMKVGNEFMPMPAYVARGFAVGRQVQAQRAQSSGVDNLLTQLAIGRAITAPAAPVQIPVTCRSYRVGSSVSTTCN